MAFKSSRKRPLVEILDDEDEKVYRFRILLPNGTSSDLILNEPGTEMPLHEFVIAVRKQVERTKTEHGSKRKIRWNGEVYLEDMFGNKIGKKLIFSRFSTHKFHMLTLHDGAEGTVHTYQNMWDLTPDTELLSELPAEYSFETALADLIDNSLQAVWSNSPNERRLISVTSDEHLISIFDSGQGMDGSDENCIVKWGKMGSSNHRHSRVSAIGGDPPYLMPYFGMYGYGGAVASMHLGRSALVSSKTKKSKKALTLALARDALLSNSGSGSIWRTDGGIRDPLEDEIQKSPHGSFTKVEICDPKVRSLDIFQLQCRLKDIYFPYIQCDEASTMKTTMHIEFQVNGVDLAEVEGGEVAVTNLHSCTGREFTLHLRFLINEDNPLFKSPGYRARFAHCEANARLKCVYFPIVEGKESIDRILEKLELEGCGISENFDNFCRVSIRRLGRLLPYARWGRLPFMECRQKKGDKGNVLKRCCLRVKCFVETDAGFSPTVYKTDLAHQDPFTTALRNFGNRPSGKESEIAIEIHRDGRPLSLSQLEKEYQDWVYEMHDGYDEEVDCGEDQPILIVSPSNKKGLGISSDVVRVHKVIKRKGVLWESGQKVKIVKGAAGFLKKNLYAILEYILLEGFQGDVGGEARIICRPLGCLSVNGCLLTVNGGSASLDIRSSLSFPISVIDSEKCKAIDNASWMQEVEKLKQKAPARIDILTTQDCHQLEIDGAPPMNIEVSAGYIAPREIFAVIRPLSFLNAGSSKSLDPKYIVKDNLEMSMELKFMGGGKDCQDGEVIYVASSKPTVHKGIHGLYGFPLEGCQLSNLFHRAGSYKFSFSVMSGTDSICKQREFQVSVRPSDRVDRWEFLHDKRILFRDGFPLSVRVGSHVPHLFIVCYDVYSNRMPFASLPEAKVKIKKNETVLFRVNKLMSRLSFDNMILEITDLLIESRGLDMIRPRYEATLEISSEDELCSVSIPCQVIPGSLHYVKINQCPQLENHLHPGDVIQKLVLELLDAYDNHVEKGQEVRLELKGFQLQDCIGLERKVDDQGYVNLSGLLKVTAFYGTNVYLAVYSGADILLEKEFQVVKRELRVISGIPNFCIAGSQLQNIVFGVFDSDGAIDESIHDELHTLMVTSKSLDADAVQYTFRHGRCTIPVIKLPLLPGVISFQVFHSHHHELCTSVEVNVMPAPKSELPPPKLELLCLPEPDANINQSQGLDCRILTVHDPSLCASVQVSPFVDSIFDDQKKHKTDVERIGLQIKVHEEKLKSLQHQKDLIRNELRNLQASMEAQAYTNMDDLKMEKEQIMKQIECKGDTAAAILSLSNITRSEEPKMHFMDGIVGIVALLGTVDSNSISRMLAEYLGENYMLAIVCKSYEAAISLEKYGMDGKIDCNRALHRAACSLKKTINGRFFVISLDEIRPYTGKLKGSDDPQKKLALTEPLLPSGKIPPGFLGFAVNMINLDNHQLHIKNSAGYGLRETLFYRLFGELQVYQTRMDMRLARTSIRSGAVSLDGGIMKRNGVMSLGHWDPEVIFPIRASRHVSKQVLDVLEHIESEKPRKNPYVKK